MNPRLNKPSSLKYKSLQHRLIRYMFLFGLLITLILGSIELYRSYKTNIDTTNQYFEHIENGSLKGLTLSLWTVNHDLAQVQIDNIQTLPEIAYVEIHSEGFPFVSSGRMPDKDQAIIRKFDLINNTLNNPVKLGQLIVIADRSKAYADAFDNFGYILFVEGLTILSILFFLSILVKRLITRHFEKISHFMEKTTWENITTPLQLDRKDSSVYEDELDILVNSYNSQRTELNDTHKQLLISESRYLELAEGSLQGMLIHVNFTPVFVNATCIKIFGYENKKDFLAVGTFLQHLFPYEQKRVLDYNRRCIAGEDAPSEYGIDCLHKDGSSLHILLTVSLIKWRNSSATLITFIDNTERKKTERELRLSEERLAKIFESSPDVILVSRISDGQIMAANHNFELIFGYSKKEAIGKTHKELDLWPQTEHVPLSLEETKTSGYLKYFETKYRKKNNGISDCSLSGHAINIKGELCLVATIRDISEQKTIRETLQKSEETFHKAFNSSPVISTITHRNTGEIIEVNKSFERLTGWTRSEAIGSSPIRLHLVTKDEYANAMGEVKKRGFCELKNSTYKTQSGKIRYCNKFIVSIEISGEQCVLANILDVTEQKIMEFSLRESEDKLLKVFESSPDAILVIRAEDGVILDTNKNIETVFGFTKEEAVGKPIQTLDLWINNDIPSKFPPEFNLDKNIKYRQIQYRKKNGIIADGYISGEMITIYNEPCMVATIRDTTKQIATQNALRLSEEKFSTAFHASPMLYIITRVSDKKIVECNATFEILSGWTHKDAIGKTTIEIQLWDVEECDRVVEEIQEKGFVKGREMRLFTKSGETRHCLLSSEIIDIAGNPCYLSIVDDITDRKLAENEILRSRERLRHLANRVEHIREEERIGIARELHDELGQAFTGLKFDLIWLSDQIPKQEITETRIKTMVKNIDANVDVVRRISSELRPPILDDLGIDAAIEWATEQFSQRTNIAHKLHVECDNLELDKNRDTVVFRIYQEALTNIARHAQAKSFKADIRIVNNELKLIVIDDGIGITEEQLHDDTAIGLLGMQERAANIGATVSIKNIKNGGTEVHLIVPLDDKEDVSS